MKKILLLALSLAAFSPLFAQAQATPAQAQQPQEVIVKFQQQPAPAPVQTTVVEKANEWVEFGKHVGSAMDAGLTSLTDHAEKFSKTDAGRFTMLVIAWKVAGKEATELVDRFIKIVAGVPILIAWNMLAFWFYRRMYLPRRVVIERTGMLWWGTRKYQIVNEDTSWSDGKTGGAFV